MNKNVLHDVTYGMYIVTTKGNEKDVGCIINTLTQITSKNPIVSISINKDNYTNKIIKECKKFAVSIISKSMPREVIADFGYKSSKDVDKFENKNYKEINGIKVITDNTAGYIICEVIDIIDAETHDIFLGRVIENQKLNDDEVMTYKYYREALKGTSPKNAPTYEENLSTNSESKKYRCIICGYIYDDAKEEVKFEDLSDDWTCPLCGAKKSDFKEV